MNNDGFADLVRKQSTISSTKAIARKAVEEEWKRNKKKRGRGKSSSDEESDEEERPWRKNKVEDEDADDAVELSADYRDRAKERREGKPSGGPTQEDDSMQLQDNHHILPAKGLDVSLARKMREDMKRDNDSEQKEDDGPAFFTTLPTLEEATKVMQQAVTLENQVSSTMSSTMVEYVQKVLDQTLGTQPKNIKCSLAGKHIQRSRLALALDGCPTDLKRSWEAPREVTHTSTFHDSQRLDMELIERIDKALPLKRYVLDNKVTRNENSLGQGAVPAEEKISSLEEREQEDNDDIFGDLEDYVAPIGKEPRNQ
jgi:hypothetical protein